MTAGASLEQRVREAVNNVADPCSVGRGVPAGLVDMGMLCDVSVEQSPEGGAQAHIVLRLTSPGCTFQLYFDRELRDRLSVIEEVRNVEITWSKEFDWSDEDMNADLRARLTAKRAAMLERVAAAKRATASAHP
jgi:metal-sulfur cluster biosynthetic enzyme